jgi:hypothetical protein
MDRRTFIRTVGATGLGLTGRCALAAAPQESPAMLVKLLEDAPREQLPAALVSRIRAGLREDELCAALCVAAARNVQPYPVVGFKYHALMVLRSIQTTTEHLPPVERWLPMIWAADYFKGAQAEERSSSGGWHMPVRSVPAGANREDSRRALATALDRWDHEAADAAITAYVRSGEPSGILPLLLSYGMRDLRDVGHKAITVACVHNLVQRLGPGEASEALLRSTVAALLNSDGEPDPATHDLGPDRPWRRNRERLHLIPATWKQGHDDDAQRDLGARAELRAALYHTSPEDAGGVVVELLQRRIAPQALWEVLFDTAAEILIHQPDIVPVHAQTTANALHYAYRISDDMETQQLALLQGAAYIAMFRQITRTSPTDANLPALEPLPVARGADPLEEIFADLAAGQRVGAIRKSLGYLSGGGDAQRLIAQVRHHLVRSSQEAHDYKLAEAVFENHAQAADPQWRARFLAAGMVYFKAPSRQLTPLMADVMKRLEA